MTPLANRIRPKNLKEFMGQNHLVGENGPIRLMIKNKKPSSLIFWGPAGCGKTTLARIIAQETDSEFIEYSATASKLADVRKAILKAEEILKAYHKKTILFIDEIHRFNKAQQDAFLPHVEKGTIILIGATTYNPSFSIISPLLSRCTVYVLNPLSDEEMEKIINRGLEEMQEVDGIKIEKKALKFLIQFANGDARIALNALENVVKIGTVDVSHCDRKRKHIVITLKGLENVLQKKTLAYDKDGEEHYNTISAFIKSMRASNPDAALYYLVRMIEVGEDPLFIARRMVIFASEDIGMAQPTALVVANEVFRACETIGLPECAINLAHGVVYLSKCVKDRSAYDGLRAAQEDVKKYGHLPIPLDLRNPVTGLMRRLGYGKDYEMYPNKNKSLLPDKLKGRKYYKPN